MSAFVKLYCCVDARPIWTSKFMWLLMPTVLWASDLYVWQVDDDKLMIYIYVCVCVFF
jgi:hypothetical protein